MFLQSTDTQKMSAARKQADMIDPEQSPKMTFGSLLAFLKSLRECAHVAHCRVISAAKPSSLPDAIPVKSGDS